jgi:general secretion pathway protein E
MAQRLIRLLCIDCREAYAPSSLECELLNLTGTSDPVLYRAVGCSSCNETGYRGRTGIYELIEIDETLREMIHDGASEQAMLAQARKNYQGIDADGRRRIIAGETCIEEVLRVTTVQ